MSAEIPGSGDIYFAQPLIHGLSHERVPALPEFYGQPVPQFRHMAACGRGPERRSVLNESVPDAQETVTAFLIPAAPFYVSDGGFSPFVQTVGAEDLPHRGAAYIPEGGGKSAARMDFSLRGYGK